MAKIDLKPLSLKELKSLKSRVEKAIERHELKRKAKAVAELKAKAKELGFSLSELLASADAKPKATAAEKNEPIRQRKRQPKSHIVIPMIIQKPGLGSVHVRHG